MKILHLSDIHAGSDDFTIHYDKLVNSTTNLIKNNNIKKIITTGDIAYKGNKNSYRSALKYYRHIIEHTDLNKKDLFFCPGNHDICTSSFRDFYHFTFETTDNLNINFESSSCHTFIFDEILFMAINTAYHKDHTYGHVEIKEISNKLNSVKDTKTTKRIAFMHHNLFGIEEKDTSAIRNSYDLLQLLDHHNFDALLSGHQHSKQYMRISLTNKLHYIGSRSLCLRSDSHETGLNIINLRSPVSHESFKLSLDDFEEGERGAFQKDTSNGL